MILKLGKQHRELKPYKVYINDDPGLALPILRQRQIGSPIRLNGKKTVTESFNEENLQQRTKFIE